MSRSRKSCLIPLGVLMAYLLSFGPVWGWYTARNQPAPDPVSALYTPILTALREPGLGLPFVAYLAMWERIYGGH